MPLTLSIAIAFAAALLAPFVHRLAPRSAALLLAAVPAGLMVHLLALAPAVLAGQPVVESRTWVSEIGLHWDLRLDGLALLFALLATGIGAPLLVYSGAYLHDAPGAGRFLSLILAFMASMLGLILADDLILLFVFWELTSLTSYFLIGFDSERKEARAAALQALLVTGAGGLALLGGILLLGAAGGTMQASALASQGGLSRSHPYHLAIVGLVLLGAFTKSAQFPFHFWLPAAMEAPTPASAYLHAATMVKAGVYLLARTGPILDDGMAWRWALVAVGGLTVLVAAWRAVVERDLKRILAHSTVGSLGLMVLLLGLGTVSAVAAALALVVAHALYKASLFLMAGAVSHQTGERDVERLGGLWRAMPLTALAAALAALSLAGLPSSLGFASKELAYGATLATPALALVSSGVAVLGGGSMVGVALLVAYRTFAGATVGAPARGEAPPALWGAALLLGLAGIVFGSFQGPVASLVAAAAAVVNPAAPAPDVVLEPASRWAPALGVAGVLLGVAAYGARRGLRRLDARIGGGWPVSPGRGYELAIGGMLATARLSTRVLQNGSLRVYLLVILATGLAVTGYALLGRAAWPAIPAPEPVRLHEALLASVVVMSVVVAAASRSRLVAVTAMGVAGYAISLLYLFLGAPDLAMTQLAVETLTVILLLAAFRHLPPFSELSTRAARSIDLAACAGAGLLMAGLVLACSAVDLGPRISEYYVANAAGLGHGRNIVNVILVDFRGLDTLGEITVLTIAGLGVLGLLELRKPDGGRSS